MIKQCATCIFKYQNRVDIAHTEHVRAKSSIYILQYVIPYYVSSAMARQQEGGSSSGGIIITKQ